MPACVHRRFMIRRRFLSFRRWRVNTMTTTPSSMPAPMMTHRPYLHGCSKQGNQLSSSVEVVGTSAQFMGFQRLKAATHTFTNFTLE